jgi:malate dehydrogenase (oxaloacetate-decarboxylating)
MKTASQAIKLHKKLRGKIETRVKVNSASRKMLKLVYTPGVAAVSREISHNREKVYEMTGKWNSVAIVSDGTRVLGLGNIGPEAALPVMEGKAILFKQFGGVDAYPVCLAEKDGDKIVEIVKALEPNFGAVNIEDIEVPKCLSIVERLQSELGIPVFHDDQHGTAIVTVAALINALKVVGKKITEARIVVAGSGAAGYGVTNLLIEAGARDIVVTDSSGALYHGRKENMNHYKEILAAKTNRRGFRGGLKEALEGADVFIGVSGKGGILKGEWVKTMARDPIIFAISNPEPEIMPMEAKKNGAKIVATGLSGYPNQINNSLVFPGLMRGILDSGTHKLDTRVFLKVSKVIAEFVKKPSARKIIPSMFERRIYRIVAKSVANSHR